MTETMEQRLFRIYMEMGYDEIVPFGGLTGEGRNLARRELTRRNRAKALSDLAEMDADDIFALSETEGG